jgi:glyoxylase-like metal-dependent hydrolase (beta-lactamase superfamily II)
MQTWMIGTARITRIEEQLGAGSFPPDRYFTGFDPEVLQRHIDWLVPNHYLPRENVLVTSVHAWLIQTRHHNILVDCCSGNHKNRHWWPRFHRLETPFLQRLAEAGVPPERVDFVMCTHLHADHVGWNTRLADGRWVPTFPNARYLFSRKECDHWDPRQHPPDDDPHRRIVFADSVLPVIEAGLAEFVTCPHAVGDDLLIEDAPGHTPGHALLRLGGTTHSGGVFCGDVIHHPLQLCAPHWNSQFCELPEQARATRRQLLARCAADGSLLLPTHFGAPHVVRVRESTGAFRPDFVNPH